LESKPGLFQVITQDPQLGVILVICAWFNHFEAETGSTEQLAPPLNLPA